MEQTKIKQVIVMRTKYPKGGIRKGKMIAQGAHASMMFLTNRIRNVPISHGTIKQDGTSKNFRTISLNDTELAWVEGKFAKICLQVGTLEELLEVENLARDSELEVHVCTDSGLTEFEGKSTVTCLAIGPDEADKIDAITGGLKLL